MDGNSEFHRLNVVDLCTGSQSSKPSWSLGKIADRILFFTKIPAPVRGIVPAIFPRQFYQLLLLELGILYQDSCYQFFQGIRDCPCCICTSLYKSCTHGKEIPELMNDLINYPHWERAVMNFGELTVHPFPSPKYFYPAWDTKWTCTSPLWPQFHHPPEGREPW